MNNGHSTGHFKCSRGAHQGDPLSVYLFILVTEMLFIQVRNCKEISGIDVFRNEFKLSAIDDTSYLILNKLSIQQLSFLNLRNILH